jgi:hypothetical protein
MSDDLLARFRAALDETELSARQANAVTGDWLWYASHGEVRAAEHRYAPTYYRIVTEACDPQARFIAANDPARVLAQVASLRKVLDELPTLFPHDEVVGYSGCATNWWDLRNELDAPNAPDRPDCDCGAEANRARLVALLAEPYLTGGDGGE